MRCDFQRSAPNPLRGPRWLGTGHQLHLVVGRARGRRRFQFNKQHSNLTPLTLADEIGRFPMERKLRFGDLVRNSGRPKTVTIWSQDGPGNELERLRRENRLFTVFQRPKQRDYGLIGFHPDPHAAYLAFPRPLPPAETGRIVGINYQMIEEPQRGVSVSARRKRKPSASTPKPKPRLKQFTVRVRRTANREETMIVQAVDQKAAEGQALADAMERPFKVRDEDIQEEVVKSH